MSRNWHVRQAANRSAHAAPGRPPPKAHSAAGPAVLCLALTALLPAGGCASVGARQIGPDRAAYTKALADSWKSQTLLNIVRLRYGDAPVFVDVSQIIGSYSVEHRGAFGYDYAERIPLSTFGNAFSIDAETKYIDRPTITYRPLTGSEFVKNVVTPVRPEVVLSLLQAGFPADRVMRLAAMSINGLSNRVIMASFVTPADPEFLRLLSLLRHVQQAGILGVRTERPKEKEAQGQLTAILFFQEDDAPPEVLAKTREIRKLLRLAPDQREYRVTYGGVAQSDKEISIQTNSISRLLMNLASFVEVPAKDIEEGRAWSAPPPPEGGTVIGIRSSPSRPSDAFADVNYRGRSYWIDDRDLVSKRALSLMVVLFAIAQPEPKGPGAVVTVSAN
jgi:hypothetical protein